MGYRRKVDVYRRQQKLNQKEGIDKDESWETKRNRAGSGGSSFGRRNFGANAAELLVSVKAGV